VVHPHGTAVMQRRTRGTGGLTAILMAASATLATIAPALADIRNGPWPS
jgi:hypothetical protein